MHPSGLASPPLRRSLILAVLMLVLGVGESWLGTAGPSLAYPRKAVNGFIFSATPLAQAYYAAPIWCFEML